MKISNTGAVVITGSNGGLGLRLVSEFLKEGFTNIACHYHAHSESISALLKQNGLDPHKHLFKADLVEENEVVALRKDVHEKFGPVWGIVNLAGASSNAVSWKLTSAEFTRVLNANLMSTFHVIREFLPGMREKSQGRIINVSSIVAHTGVPGASHYCASKAAIEGLTKAIAQEVASKLITVNCLALGYFDEGLIRDVPPEHVALLRQRIPIKRLGNASEIYPLVSYLLSPGAEFMTGQVLHLNGGQYT